MSKYRQNGDISDFGALEVSTPYQWLKDLVGAVLVAAMLLFPWYLWL